jgi:hypothetical protein
MPTSSLIIIVGSWIALAIATLVAYRFNRHRGDD